MVRRIIAREFDPKATTFALCVLPFYNHTFRDDRMFKELAGIQYSSQLMLTRKTDGGFQVEAECSFPDRN